MTSQEKAATITRFIERLEKIASEATEENYEMSEALLSRCEHNLIEFLINQGFHRDANMVAQNVAHIEATYGEAGDILKLKEDVKFYTTTLKAILADLQDPIYEPTMNIGKEMKRAFLEMLRIGGCDVEIHKDWGMPTQRSFTARALQNSEKNRSDLEMFQFPDRIDLEPDDVIQIKGSENLWIVIEVLDEMSGNELINYRANVERTTRNQLSSRDGLPKATNQVAGAAIHNVVTITAHNLYQVQVGSTNSSQNLSIQTLNIEEK